MIYLDNAATGFPKNPKCYSAMEKALATTANSGRSVYEYADNAAITIYKARSALAKLFGAKPENVVLTQNATHALNIAIKGLSNKHREIVISDLEHNAVLRPAHSAFDSVRIFETDLQDDGRTVINLSDAISKKTDLVCITYASNVCGRILPVKELVALSHKKGVPVIIDASQAAGHTPIDIKDLGCDVLCIPCHKGLYAPTGTGALIASDRCRSIKPLVEGGTGSASREIEMPRLLPERLEAGTPAVISAAAIHAACEDFEYQSGESAIYEYVLSELKTMDVKLYGAPIGTPDNYCPVIAFNKVGVTPAALAERLASLGVCVRSGLHCAPLAHDKLRTGQYGAVRVSIGKNNTFADADGFLRALNT